MKQLKKERLVEQYRKEKQDVCARLAQRATRYLWWQVRQCFLNEKLPVVFRRESRAKSLDSLYRNLLDGKEKYKGLERELKNCPLKELKVERLFGYVKDLAGGRLIFYFRDDLERFYNHAEINIEQWYGENTKIIPKRAESDNPAAELFGYDSYHITGCLDSSENSLFGEVLFEDDRTAFNEIPFEIQLRTLFQHGWAEPEHELRYKSDAKQTEEEKRWWAILAALVETCDRTLDERKKAVKKRDSDFIRISYPSWKYEQQDRRYHSIIGGVRYAYQLLHHADESEMEPRLHVMRPFEDFNIDREMKDKFRIGNYKERVWKELKSKKPEFLRSMTHDERVVRVKEWDKIKNIIRVEPAQYSDQMVTNHRKAHDIEVEGKRVKQLAYSNGDEKDELLSFRESTLSNTIGVSCVIRTSDNKWLICRRSSGLAHEAGSWGTSASGALAWSEPDTWNGKKSIENEHEWYEVGFDRWVKEGLAHECEQELGWRPADPSWFTYLAFAREWGRLGKPQIFFLGDMHLLDDGLESDQLEAKWAMYASTGEHVDLRFLNDKDARILVGMQNQKVQEIIGENVLSEELRFNLALTLDKQEKLD